MAEQPVWPDHARELLAELAAAPSRLCLVTGDDAEAVTQQLATALGVQPCQVGKLVTDSPSVSSVGEIASLLTTEVVLVALDVLFWPALAVDPLGLLQDLSRFRPRIALWPGVVEGRRAQYSDPGRPDAYDQPLDDALLLHARRVRFPDEVPYTLERVLS